MYRAAARSIYHSLGQAKWAAFRLRRKLLEYRLRPLGVQKVNLCCGPKQVPGYFGIDVIAGCDLHLDISRYDLPFRDDGLEAVVCMSAINYFTRRRAEELVRETFRVLRQGGVCRMGVQDMRALSERYLRNDTEFFFQKLPDGKDRFEGPTIGDKFAAWFYGYAIKGMPCRYFYDYDSLAYLFKEAGFSIVDKKQFRESRLKGIELIDNRPDQMFFLEAVK
jgi:predicted SAM-dependent methyltransferase